MKKIIKWIIAPVGLIVGLLYLTDYDYILKGVRVVYLTGHTTAFIDDLIYFENDTIPASTLPQPWANHKNYNRTKSTERLTEINNEFGTVAFLIIKNDSVW